MSGNMILKAAALCAGLMTAACAAGGGQTAETEPGLERLVIVTDTGDATIVSAVIDMARKLKQRVIAEGVETSGQMGFLRDHHCHQGQGYHFSHPVDARAFQDLLAKPRVC